MQEAIEDLIVEPSVPADVAEHIERAEKWAGEPFLHPGEDAERVLARGTARRRALDDAIAEMDAGERVPTPKWKVRYGLMLGLERILSDKPPRLASGTELRRHQIDALAGMLTELIAANQQPAELNGNGNGAVVEVEEEEDEDFELERAARTRSPSGAHARGGSRVRSAATASGTRPPRARRSRPPASSRRRARSAC